MQQTHPIPMLLSRPAQLSAEEKQQGRRQCCFGCIFCGSPLYNFFYLQAESRLVLICPLHQYQLEKSLLSPTTLLTRAAEPINFERTNLAGFRVDHERRIQLSVGMNTFYSHLPVSGGDYPLIWVNGRTLFSLHSDKHWLSFSCEQTSLSGQPQLHIEQGELLSCPDGWEFSYELMTLKIRDEKKRLISTIQLCNDRVMITKGLFLDEHQDGFIIEGNRVIAQLDGHKGGEYSKRIEPGTYKGGWALFNKVRLPDLSMPGNFAFICAAKRKNV